MKVDNRVYFIEKSRKSWYIYIDKYFKEQTPLDTDYFRNRLEEES